MANITINQTPSRAQYTASGGQTVYTYSFPIKADTDLKVYSRIAGSEPDDEDDLLTLTTDYTVQGANTSNGGTVTLVVGSTAGDIVTIVGDKPIDRTAIYDQSSTLKKADLNNDFNDNIMYDKQTSTLMEQLSPAYHRSEKIYRDLDNRANDVRADNLYLPILNDGYIWVGRGNDGDDPDDIVAVLIGDFDALGILSAEYILGAPNAALPNAQDLNALGEGILYTTPDGDGTATVSLLNIGAGLQLNTTTDTLSVIADGGVTVNQAHTFDVGDWLYRSSGSYALADASAAATAEAIGVVVEVVDANNFILQQSGMVTGGTDGLAGLTDGTLYYLSDSNPGEMTSTEPTDPASYSRPVYVATDTDEGWILPQRKILNSDFGGGGGGNNPIYQETHNLETGDWVRINGSGDFVKAQANSAENAECVGVVSQKIDDDYFILQMLDYVDLTGVTYATVGPDAFTPGAIYFLDESNDGDITATEPTDTNEVSKPMFVALTVSTGYILHYRGVVADSSSGGGGGGGTWQEIDNYTITGTETNIDFDNIFDGSYTQIKVFIAYMTCSGTVKPVIRFGNGSTYYDADYTDTTGGLGSNSGFYLGSNPQSANHLYSGEMLIPEPSMTTWASHTVKYSGQNYRSPTSGITSIDYSGAHTPVAAGTAITSLQFKFEAAGGTYLTGHIKIMGLTT